MCSLEKKGLVPPAPVNNTVPSNKARQKQRGGFWLHCFACRSRRRLRQTCVENLCSLLGWPAFEDSARDIKYTLHWHSKSLMERSLDDRSRTRAVLVGPSEWIICWEEAQHYTRSAVKLTRSWSGVDGHSHSSWSFVLNPDSFVCILCSRHHHHLVKRSVSVHVCPPSWKNRWHSLSPWSSLPKIYHALPNFSLSN